MKRVRCAILILVGLTVFALTEGVVLAQIDEPIGHYVVDARLTWARFKEDPGVAAAIDVTPTNLPDSRPGHRRRCPLVSPSRLPHRSRNRWGVLQRAGQPNARAYDGGRRRRRRRPDRGDDDVGADAAGFAELRQEGRLELHQRRNWNRNVHMRRIWMRSSARALASRRSITAAAHGGSSTSTWRFRSICGSTR